MDTLEYTREGLRAREPLRLEGGQRHRVVIVRPYPVRSIAASHGGFAARSVFPGPAVLSVFLFEHEGATSRPFSAPASQSAVYQVYGHADATGSEHENKKLADDRARIGVALLTADVVTAQELASEYGWGVEEAQVMLRVLECDPGPIDGEVGPLTQAALESFIERYEAGEFHAQSALSPRESGLSDPKFGQVILAALVEAYIVWHSPHIALERLHPTHPWAGCAAFNPVSGDLGALNRRLSVVVHTSLPEHHDAAPCSAGDETACAVFGDEAQKCMWFRHHVVDARWADVEHHQFRANWLELPSGRYLLSTLTTLPDDEDIEFQVFAASEPLDRIPNPTAEQRLEPMSGVIVTKARHGVAQVVWEPPADFAPGVDGRIVSSVHGRVVPTFRASHSRTTTHIHDSFPAHEVGILFHRGAPGSAFTGHHATKLVLESEDNGFQAELASTDARPWDDEHYVLRFEGTPPQGRYSLRVVYADGAEIVVFKDLPYDQLTFVASVPAPVVLQPPVSAEAAPDSSPDENQEDPEFRPLDFDEVATGHWP